MTAVFVDESKAGAYLLVGAQIPTRDVHLIRSKIRRIALPGQRRIHMKAESRQRKLLIAATIAALGVEFTIFDAKRAFSTEKMLVKRSYAHWFPSIRHPRS
ncbi:hypothetical protein KEM60_00899 [Austwickia sp. TVS 96-490-7B]|uniref:hypothetical protein n=1 Tax=Austwickia sp. TVS 96-490-7B TaxID=2830843 RepID=UPI001C581671|nr:hypothetical protein [Austwickia sp. TVS 96-490-7B]MBW3084710.1 hypothetical protein [Austwickia sp. TVS 96-490-7B]